VFTGYEESLVDLVALIAYQINGPVPTSHYLSETTELPLINRGYFCVTLLHLVALPKTALDSEDVRVLGLFGNKWSEADIMVSNRYRLLKHHQIRAKTSLHKIYCW
jgi:hypothetical protein